MDKVQSEDKAKAVNNLDYITLALDNVELGFRQFLLDLPLDYHTEDFDEAFIGLVDELEDLIKDYEERIL